MRLWRSSGGNLRKSGGCAIACLLLSLAHAQEPWVDSLKHVLHGTREAKARLHLLARIADSNDDATSDTFSRTAMALADSLLAQGNAADTSILQDQVSALLNQSFHLSMYGEQDSAVLLSQRALAIGERLKDKRMIARAERMMAAPLGRAERVDEAITHATRALTLQQELGDSLGIAKSCVSIGYLYRQIGNDPMALDWFMRAQRGFEHLRDDNNTAIALVNIANVQTNFGQLDSALTVYAQALALYRRAHNTSGAAMTYNNMAQNLSHLKRYDEALAACEAGLAIAEPANDRYNMGALYRDVGIVLQAQGHAAEALASYRKALPIIREVNEPRDLVSTLVAVARAHLSLAEVKPALAAGLEAEKNMGAAQPLDRSEVMNVLSEIYARTGDKPRELDYYRRYIALQDTVKNEENSRKVLQTFFRAEYDKRTAALKAEQQRKEEQGQVELDRQKLMRNASATVGAVLLVLTFLLLNRYRRKRRAHRELEGQNRMIAQEKRRSDELLSNILPGDVAAELKATGSAEARQYDRVTVLFTDFKGFTSLVEKLTPAELVAELDTCFKAFDHIITAHGIEKIKTIGDAYMAAGGLPVPSAESTRRTVLAALEMQAFMLAHKAQRQAIGAATFDMRVGIHTGPVIAGIVGVKKYAYDVWGDTVNIASRMESSGEVGEVNISGATRDLLLDDPDLLLIPRGRVSAKGKGELEMYFVRRR